MNHDLSSQKENKRIYRKGRHSQNHIRINFFMYIISYKMTTDLIISKRCFINQEANRETKAKVMAHIIR